MSSPDSQSQQGRPFRSGGPNATFRPRVARVPGAGGVLRCVVESGSDEGQDWTGSGAFSPIDGRGTYTTLCCGLRKEVRLRLETVGGGDGAGFEIDRIEPIWDTPADRPDAPRSEDLRNGEVDSPDPVT